MNCFVIMLVYSINYQWNQQWERAKVNVPISLDTIERRNSQEKQNRLVISTFAHNSNSAMRVARRRVVSDRARTRFRPFPARSPPGDIYGASSANVPHTFSWK